MSYSSISNKLWNSSCFKQGKTLKMAQNRVKPFTIVIEGNIGSGKTTFINNFQNNKNISALTEPISKWKNVNGHDLVKLLYSDIKSWAFTFQTYVQVTMMELHQQQVDKPVKMMERSLYSSRYVFVENLSKMNILSCPEVAVLDEWFKWLINKNSFSVDLIVYLRTDPEVTYQRIQNRCREGENLISFDYIKQLHENYENWLLKKKKFPCPAPVLSLNANKNLTEILHEYKYFENQMDILSSGHCALNNITNSTQ